MMMMMMIQFFHQLEPGESEATSPVLDRSENEQVIVPLGDNNNSNNKSLRLSYLYRKQDLVPEGTTTTTSNCLRRCWIDISIVKV